MKNILFAWEHKDGKGPWGGKSSKPKSNQPKGEQQTPDIEHLIRHAQNRLNRGGAGFGGGGQGGGKLFGFVALAAVVIWLLSGFYIVDQSERGVVLRFGEHVQTTGPGLNYRLPWPVETVYKPKVERENRVEVGFRSVNQSSAVSNFRTRPLGSSFNSASTSELESESLMLTGDENIVDLDFTIRWKINDAANFLFNVVYPEKTIKDVAESAMREVIGKRPIDDALTANKAEIELAGRELIQQVVDTYGLGVQINAVELQKVNPPEQVIDAYKDVQAARADAEKLQNEATGYANNIVPRARGESARIMQEAEGYKEAKVADATGRSQRFNEQLREYKLAQNITERRMYLEAMEDVLKSSTLFILGGESGQSVLPYLPIAGKNNNTQGGR